MTEDSFAGKPDGPETLYRIDPTTEEQCHASKEWLSSALGTVLCSKCKTIHSDWYPNPVDVIMRPAPKRAAYVHLWWTEVKVFRRDVIAVLQPLMNKFIVGTCEAKEPAEVIEDYVTCYACDRLVLRGDEYSRYFECDLCEASWLQPARKQPMLCMDADQLPATEQHVFQNWNGTLYIDRLAADALRAQKVEGVRLLKVVEIRDRRRP